VFLNVSWEHPKGQDDGDDVYDDPWGHVVVSFLVVVVYGIARYLIGSINAAMSIMIMTRKKLMRTELLMRNAIWRLWCVGPAVAMLRGSAVRVTNSSTVSTNPAT